MVGIYDVPGIGSELTMDKDLLLPLRRLHGELYQAGVRMKMRSQYRKYFREHPNTVFLVLTPHHGNLGDHAIAQAEINMLRRAGINYIEITGQGLSEMYWAKHLSVMNGFPILINGGGNLGTLWMDVETLEREIIKSNPKSEIFILPNTIFYEESDWGRREFQITQKIYNRHKKLHLYAREKISYGIMNKVYRDVKLVPDMVFSMEPQTVKRERKGCLLCLRDDCEKTMSEEQLQTIRQQVKVLFGESVYETDTVEKRSILPENREQALNRKFEEFCGAKLVVTDRLHGMVFCAITGTPCILLDSKSPKVQGCYEWIRELEYIRFINDVSQITEEYRKIPLREHQYNNSSLIPFYEELIKDIMDRL